MYRVLHGDEFHIHGEVVVPGRKQVELSDVVVHFEELEDPRSSVNLRHPLPSVVVIALMAILTGADGPTGIREWAQSKEDMLRQALELPFGIPSKDVFRRVLMAVKPDAFQACFVAWLKTLKLGSETADDAVSVLAVDGKTLRGSHDRGNGLGPLHLVSVWMTQAGLSLGQVATDVKSNEITAIPELIRLVDISGAIITIDAMGAQTAIAAEIIEQGGDYVLALKGNQATVHEAVIDFMDEHLQDDFARVDARRHVVKDKSKGRLETRTYIQCSAPRELPGLASLSGLRTIGVAVYKSTRGATTTIDIRYFLSSLRLGVKQFSRAVRSHWNIENACHWTLDVTYREDHLRTRDRQLAENLAWLRRFTLSLLKQHPAKKSVAMKRRLCGWNDNFLMQVLTTHVT